MSYCSSMYMFLCICCKYLLLDIIDNYYEFLHNYFDFALLFENRQSKEKNNKNGQFVWKNVNLSEEEKLLHNIQNIYIIVYTTKKDSVT